MREEEEGGSICLFGMGTPRGGNTIIRVRVKPNLVSVLQHDAESLSESACQTAEITQSAPPVCDLHSADSSMY